LPQPQPVKAVVIALGVQQTDLARLLAVSQPTAHRILSGDYPPTPEQAALVAQYLGFPESELWRPERRARARRSR
jgi:predicted transcriptional regulator